jgi:hypothetical protein
MGQAMIASSLCLVVRGVDAFERPMLCLKDATVEISADTMRRREVCARCAGEMLHLRPNDVVKMRLLRTVMGMLLR